MSAASSLRRAPTNGNGTLSPMNAIHLVDTERSAEPETLYSDVPTAPSTPGPSPLTKKLTSNSLQLQQSLKQEWKKRKYAKYSRGRYEVNNENAPSETAGSEDGNAPIGNQAQASYVDRAAKRARGLLKRKRILGAGIHAEDTVIDILYENQRGAFIFGIPKYSAASLLPSDPKPWQNAHLKASPVDIRNAQVPDPSWEWVWKNWYVDMSRDVDEEGWEYSFQFAGKFAWHGNHPWFHSFVRRRRWLRLRRRKASADEPKTKRNEGHELTAEYFTIHPQTRRLGLEDVSQMPESELARLLREKEQDIEVEKIEVRDIGSLTLALKKAKVDREKLVAVRKFVEDGEDELYYLSERMPEIMATFVFQSSRRHLLTELLQRYDETSKRKESLSGHEHSDEKTRQEHDKERKRAENLIRAVQAADEQVQKLEYWSDIKGISQNGHTFRDSWNGEKWQGLSSPISHEEQHSQQPFLSKQSASDGVRDLHGHPEHDGGGVKGKESSVFWDAQTQTKDSSEDTQGAYTTAAESASRLDRRRSGKGKAKLERPSSLDGVLERSATDEAEDKADAEAQTSDGEIDPETGETFMTPPERAMSAGTAQARTPNISSGNRSQDVQVVEPDPLADEPDLPSPALKGS